MTSTVAHARDFRAARRRPRERIVRWGLILAAALLALFLGVLALGRLAAAGGAPVRDALEDQLAQARAPAAITAFYEARDYDPMWVEPATPWNFWRPRRLLPEAAQLASAIDHSPTPGLSPAARQRLAALLGQARGGDPQALAQAELGLSIALTEHARALRSVIPAALPAFVDPDLAQPVDPQHVLEEAAAAPSLAERLAALEDVNPIYKALRDQLAAYHAQWGRLPQVQVPEGPVLNVGAGGERVARLRQRLGLAGEAYDNQLAEAVRRFQAAHGLAATGQADAQTVAALNSGAGYYEHLIRANLERARALPPLVGDRYVLVNVPAGQLEFHDKGAVKGQMRVVVGARDEQTPMMVGLMRNLVFNPYWEIPVDLVRSSLAPKVVKFGPGYLAANHMEPMSDWDENAFPINPRDVDWRAVASGAQEVRVRQRPGGDNMMGTVKFMLPNELGIYLHDTPEKAAFQAPNRLISAGCVRLERAQDLVAWLLGDERPKNPAKLGPNRSVDLLHATPVYITYLTAAPGPQGVRFSPDVYGRDPPLLAQVR